MSSGCRSSQETGESRNENGWGTVPTPLTGQRTLEFSSGDTEPHLDDHGIEEVTWNLYIHSDAIRCYVMRKRSWIKAQTHPRAGDYDTESPVLDCGRMRTTPQFSRLDPQEIKTYP